MDGFESAWGNYKAIQTLNIITTDGVEAEISAVPPMNPTQFCVAPVLYRSARRGSEHSPFLGTIALPSVIREGEEEGVPGAEVERARPIPKRKPLSSFSIPTLGSSFAASSEYTRPIRSFKGTSSSFVRLWDGIPLSTLQIKSLNETNAGSEVFFLFYTNVKSIVWVQLGGSSKDSIAKVSFGEAPTCCDVNRMTATSERLDVLTGFGSGDIFWFDPFYGRYTRFNKAGVVIASAVTSIKWLPPRDSSLCFMSSHADGSILTWSVDRDEPPTQTTTIKSPRPPGKENDIVVERNQVDKKPGTLFNPITHWQVSDKPIRSFSLSEEKLAIVGDDGQLRIIDMIAEKVLDCFSSYFGALETCVWSPDGRFVITGGQDDLCTIYAPLELRVVARGTGHSSFVKGIAWDATDNSRSARFASVSEDCRIILWDLSLATLSRPRDRRHESHHSLSSRARKATESHSYLPEVPSLHSAPDRASVSVLQPSTSKVISKDPLSDLILLGDHIITLSRIGQIRLFQREEE